MSHGHIHESRVVHTRSQAHLMQHAWVQIVLVLAVVGVVLWAMFMANYPPVHDAFHELRHALYIIPCH